MQRHTFSVTCNPKNIFQTFTLLSDAVLPIRQLHSASTSPSRVRCQRRWTKPHDQHYILPTVLGSSCQLYTVDLHNLCFCSTDSTFPAPVSKLLSSKYLFVLAIIIVKIYALRYFNNKILVTLSCRLNIIDTSSAKCTLLCEKLKTWCYDFETANLNLSIYRTPRHQIVAIWSCQLLTCLLSDRWSEAITEQLKMIPPVISVPNNTITLT